MQLRLDLNQGVINVTSIIFQAMMKSVRRKVNILIIDDHPIFRKGLIHLLRDDGACRFDVIDEAGDKKTALEKLNSVHFDIILMDISMPGRNGIDLLPEIRRFSPKTRILMLSIYPEEQYAVQSIRSGASGYLSKSCRPEELFAAISKVTAGGLYISENMAEQMTKDLIVNRRKRQDELLSAREKEVVTLLAVCGSIKCIAARLSLSPKTISTYRERILSKLALRTTADIIRYAINAGLNA